MQSSKRATKSSSVKIPVISVISVIAGISFSPPDGDWPWRPPALREEFWSNLRLLGGASQLNQELEKANRVGGYFELAELMCIDALERDIGTP